MGMSRHNRRYHRLTLQLVFITQLVTRATGQCSGTETYEKVTRATVSGVTGSPLYSNSGGTVTEGCLTSADVTSNTKPQPVDQALNYFQKICINSPPCGKAWMLERVVGFEVEGYDDLVLNNIPTRLKCAELCIGERNLKCRSAEYHERDGVCRLSRQDRRTQPLSFRPTSPHVHYMENQCAGIPQTQHCEYEELPQQDMGHGDVQFAVRNVAECQQTCESELSFNCRSYTWYSHAKVCRLSGDDIVSAGPSAVNPQPGATYYQRTTCLDLRLACSVDAMTVQLHTSEPFKGRLFSRDFPASCHSLDKGSTDTSLIIKFTDPECGVMDEGGGIYSNVIVVQHHPVIQRRGDKAIKLLCLFETSNKTVTDSFNFIVDSNYPGGGVATAIVNATAPTPRIRLRIVDRDGNDINGARLGEELYLRLDLDSDSVYGILARNLVAKSGDNSDSIMLLDDRGCPVDPVIFPSLQPVPGSRSLQGKFEAFKFSEDQVVRFQVNVQFCLEECRPAQCGAIVSYGRKRRGLTAEGGLLTLDGELTLVGGEVTLGGDDVEEIDPDTIYHEMPLQKEIIVNSNTVQPLKTGLLPEETDARRLAQLVCTSREVVIAIIVSAVILQVCIVLVAIMCVFARRRKHTPEEPHVSTLSRGVRSPYTVTSDDSVNTLKSLRTSLRD
ncbi:Cuticlin-1-like 2 [Homarus americanus]|uniref:Cuticlin-1-like 2 n=1 Tax=Homarus americanus TaxID=6706 RepID=A0A8J5JDK0_HOMAM|nr:Cuticlin-1-like 2 [Homarus americanus]